MLQLGALRCVVTLHPSARLKPCKDLARSVEVLGGGLRFWVVGSFSENKSTSFAALSKRKEVCGQSVFFKGAVSIWLQSSQLRKAAEGIELGARHAHACPRS